ncbi:MAG: hypothetical protein ACUVUH_05540 [bacterium]
MKRLFLLILAAIPLLAFSANFVYCDYDYDDDYWDDEYWYPEPYNCDGYWVYYPDGYYCVYYVWYHPWWWDWYWWHCHWCHHFDWHFFRAGFYVVWYEDGCWWFRPRYGRWVRYKIPYAYNEFRYKARSYGINLPEKPTREINIPYNEKEIQRLTKEKDPQLYARIEKEHKSGNLERMRQEYEKKTKREIAVKNEEYRKTKVQNPYDGPYDADKNSENRTINNKRSDFYYDDRQKSDYDNSRIIKKSKSDSDNDIEAPQKYDRNYDDTDKGNGQKKDITVPHVPDGSEREDEYHTPKSPKTPIRNLPLPDPKDERRTDKRQNTKKSRR